MKLKIESKTLILDKEVVYKMGTTNSLHTIMNAYEIGHIDKFGIERGILNSHNYGTTINRLKKALESLYLDNKCERFKFGRGYSYDFTINFK